MNLDHIGARQCVQLRACNPTGENPVKLLFSTEMEPHSGHGMDAALLPLHKNIRFLLVYQRSICYTPSLPLLSFQVANSGSTTKTSIFH